MSESTLLEPQQTQENKIESALERMQDDTQEASADLLPLVYAELRKLAESRLAAEPAGQTLQPTALVHEAYLRLTKKENAQKWNSRGHFFGGHFQGGTKNGHF